MKINFYFLSALMLLFACQKSPESDQIIKSHEGIHQSPPPPPQSDMETKPELEESPRKLIRTGEINFTVYNLDSAHARITKLANASGSFVSDESLESYGNHRAYRMTLRVRPSRLDPLIAEILNGSKSLEHKKIETEDVSQHYYDLESRIKSKKALEQRYYQLLTKADKMEDMLQIEGEAARLREDIESMEGSLHLLKSQVSLSTLRLYFHETITHEEPGTFSRVGKNFQNGWEGLMNTLIALVNIWPLLLLFVAVWLGYKRYKRER